MKGSRRPERFAPLDDAQRAAWERALALWGVAMHDARALVEGGQRGRIAWFEFPPRVTIDPEQIAGLGGADELESIFAHEVGHHVVSPSTALDAHKIQHQMGRALVASGAPRVDRDQVALLANLWTDLLVNTRLEALQSEADPAREAGIVRSMRALTASSRGHDARGDVSRVGWLYMTTLARLWRLEPGALAPPTPPGPPQLPQARPAETDLEHVEERFREKERALRAAAQVRREAEQELRRARRGDPRLDVVDAADAVRTFAHDPISGAVVFGLIAAPYLLDDAAEQDAQGGRGTPRGGPCDVSVGTPGEDEMGRILADRRLTEPLPQGSAPTDVDRALDPQRGRGEGQRLGPAQTAAVHGAAPSDAATVAWYRAAAGPWVLPWTQRRGPQDAGSVPGPLELWDLGDELADIDWAASFARSTPVIPGVTTQRRSALEDEPARRDAAITLDLFIDSSGSMIRPDQGSPAIVAGAILCLSILRGGGRVRVTSFSGPGQVAGDLEHTRRLDQALASLLHFFGGSTAFPLDLLERRFGTCAPADAERVRHLVVLSDDGLMSMFGVGDASRSHVAAAVRPAFTTATLMLMDPFRRVADHAAQAGYDVLYIDSMADAPQACARLGEVLRG